MSVELEGVYLYVGLFANQGNARLAISEVPTPIQSRSESTLQLPDALKPVCADTYSLLVSSQNGRGVLNNAGWGTSHLKKNPHSLPAATENRKQAFTSKRLKPCPVKITEKSESTQCLSLNFSLSF